jgi:phosphate transport system substrate-binding protein
MMTPNQGDHSVKFKPGARFASTAVALTVTSALLLSACSSSSKSNSSSGSSAGGATTSAASTSGAATGSGDCPSGTLKGEGSTAQTNAMTSWVNGFQKQCSGATVNYNPTGSGPGVAQFIGKQVNFAGSDAALDPTAGEPAKAKTACGSTALDLPMVVGPVAVAFKLKGVADAGITLTPKVTTQIFLGKITKWNDPAITAINKGVSLPATDITVFFRSDQSGTTSNFEKYLAANDPTDFTATPGKTWAGKVGQGKAKSQGVQQAISSTEGSIGYIEYAFALSGNLSTAKIDNGGGAVALSSATASAAAAAAKITGTGNDLTLKLDYATKVAGAYPIVLVTYEIVCSKYADPKIGTFVKDFLTYTSTTGQSGLPDLGYAPLPTAIKAKLTAAIASIS